VLTLVAPASRNPFAFSPGAADISPIVTVLILLASP
jgi:hypothetical protein